MLLLPLVNCCGDIHKRSNTTRWPRCFRCPRALFCERQNLEAVPKVFCKRNNRRMGGWKVFHPSTPSTMVDLKARRLAREGFLLAGRYTADKRPQERSSARTLRGSTLRQSLLCARKQNAPNTHGGAVEPAGKWNPNFRTACRKLQQGLESWALLVATERQKSDRLTGRSSPERAPAAPGRTPGGCGCCFLLRSRPPCRPGLLQSAASFSDPTCLAKP